MDTVYFDLETITSGFTEQFFNSIPSSENEKPWNKESVLSLIRGIERDYHLKGLLNGKPTDSYYLFADSIEFYLTQVFKTAKNSNVYRDKALRIINNIKSGQKDIEKLEDLVKIFISCMRCCSNTMEKRKNFICIPISADTPFHFSLDATDINLINTFQNCTFYTEIPQKRFLTKKNRLVLLDDDQQTFIFIVTIFICLRILAFEGLFAVQGKDLYHE